jgi:hypothetical protein
VAGPPSTEILVSQLEQLISILGLRGFEMPDPFSEDVLTAVQLNESIPHETSMSAYSPTSHRLAPPLGLCGFQESTRHLRYVDDLEWRLCGVCISDRIE